MFEFNHESLLAPNKLNHSTLFVWFLNIKKNLGREAALSKGPPPIPRKNQKKFK